MNNLLPLQNCKINSPISRVKQAELIIAEKKMNKEYSDISGNAEFCKLAAELALGEIGPHVTTVQVI